MPTFIDILIGRGNGTCSRVRISFRIRGDLKGIINTLDDNLFHTGRTIMYRKHGIHNREIREFS